jgi:hypothetical protein
MPRRFDQTTPVAAVVLAAELVASFLLFSYGRRLLRRNRADAHSRRWGVRLRGDGAAPHRLQFR